MSKIDDLVKRICETSGQPEDEVTKLIKDKEAEFSGLISIEGAAHIVAKELGVNLLEKKEVKIADVVPDLQSVSIIGKVTQKFEPREFNKKDGTKGAVGNVVIADETGTIRLSLWDEQLKTFEQIKEGDVIHIINAYTKEGLKGPELRIGKRSMMKKSDQKIEAKTAPRRESRRVNLKDINVGDNIEARAAIVQIFENNPFFVKKAEEGKEEPPKLVLNGVADDGTANIRIVAFAESVEKMVGKTTAELLKLASGGINPKPVIEKYKENLGKEFVFKGYIKLNNFFERPEFIINDVTEVNPQEEAKTLLKFVEKK